MVFAGVVNAAQLLELLQRAAALLDAHGLCGVLVNGQNGRLARDNTTLRVLSKMAPLPMLRRMVVLTSDDLQHPSAVVGSGRDRMNSLVKLFFGIHVVYLSDEARARRLVQAPPHDDPFKADNGAH